MDGLLLYVCYVNINVEVSTLVWSILSLHAACVVRPVFLHHLVALVVLSVQYDLVVYRFVLRGMYDIARGARLSPSTATVVGANVSITNREQCSRQVLATTLPSRARE